MKYFLFFFLISSPAFAERLNEDFYNSMWCSQMGGTTDVPTPSGARVDCLLDDMAVEADWSEKWAEAIGQSLHYAGQFNRQAAILFLVHEESRPAHLLRLEQTISDFSLPIVIFVVDAPKNK